MARARAPGKLVLSGAYSVLYGAPAIVTAVSRCAFADAELPAVHVAEEVRAAVELGLIAGPCLVNADALRISDGAGASRKIGLGSSAAILVATLVAHGVIDPSAPPTPEFRETARERLFTIAYDVHRRAQGGGSGIDIAASVFGGTQSLVRTAGAQPGVAKIALPKGAVIEVYAARESAITSAFVERVRAFAASSEAVFIPIIERAKSGAVDTLAASTVEAFSRGLSAQRRALELLGDHAGVPIVTADVRALASLAEETGHVFLPSGAGGGDIAYAFGGEPTTEAFRRQASERGYTLVDLSVDAPGASLVEDAVHAPRSDW